MKVETLNSLCTMQATQQVEECLFQAAQFHRECLSAVLTVYIVLRMEGLSESHQFQGFPEAIELFTSSVIISFFFAEWNVSSLFRTF